MKKVIEYLTGFVDRCAACKGGRRGDCPWMKRYKAEAAKYLFEMDETYEGRATILYGNAGEPCDDQLSFDEFVAGVDIHLTNGP